jgi:tetratricopeptide (TPR) repeat protein
MESLRSERPASGALTGGERDARIEQLLLSGLDHYFSGDYDHAINLWTRVLFLDRNHDRARAYIDRARAAQAEKLRESEALIHQGLDALDEGDIARARDLVSEALARGASRDLALGVLDRIERLGVPAKRTPEPPRTTPSWLKSRASSLPSRTSTTPPKRRRWTAALQLLVIAAGIAAVLLSGLTMPDVTRWWRTTTARRSAPFVMPAGGTLPMPSATEAYLERGRSLYQSGRLRDALRELERIPMGDAARPEADRLRGQIQQALLATIVNSR